MHGEEFCQSVGLLWSLRFAAKAAQTGSANHEQRQLCSCSAQAASHEQSQETHATESSAV